MKKQIMELLGQIAIAGELPSKAVKRIHGSDGYKRKCIMEARQKNLIRHFRKDGLNGLRLTAKGKKLLLESSPERFGFFLKDGSKASSGAQKRTRLHRVAEAYVLMNNAGVEIYRDRKPPLFSAGEAVPIRFPAYYGSKEVKELGQESVKIKNSRFVGVLVTPDQLFAVYNAGAGQMKWYGQAEERLACSLPRVLQRQGAFVAGEVETKGILLADSMERFHLFLDDQERKAAFPIDNGQFWNWNMHWIPNSEEGETVLGLLCSPKKNALLTEALQNNFPPLPIGQRNMEMDAVDEAGNPVLFAYDMDAARIRRFAVSLRVNGGCGTVICFDFQRKLVERLCENCAQVLELDWKAIREDLNV